MRVSSLLLGLAAASINETPHLGKVKIQAKQDTWTYVPTTYPTPIPTLSPTAVPTHDPTSNPTRDLTRILKTRSEIGSSEVVWYSSTTNDLCTGTIDDVSCPKARRCILATTENGQTYTSTCSHVHCAVETNENGRKYTSVKHHHAETYGLMHICQQGLHKDYGHADHCGCECFDKLTGDNDWLSGLASRNIEYVTLNHHEKVLRVHTKVAGRDYIGKLHKEHGTGEELWDGSAPTNMAEIHNHPGYENYKGVVGYNIPN